MSSIWFELRSLRAVLFSLLTFVFGLQFLRLLPPTLIYTDSSLLGVSSYSRAPLAVAIFLLALFGIPLVRIFRPRFALLLTGAGVGIARLCLQIAEPGSARLALVIGGLACFFWFVPLFLSSRKAPFPGNAPVRTRNLAIHPGLLIAFAFALDTMLFGLHGTRDYAWDPGRPALLLTIGLCFLQFACLPVRNPGADASLSPVAGWRGALPCVAFGPLLFLHAVAAQNIARGVSVSGASLPAVSLLITIGNCSAILILITIVPRMSRTLAWVACAAVLSALVLGIAWPVVGLFALHPALAIWLAWFGERPQIGGASATDRGRFWPATLLFTIGMLGYLYLLLIHYGAQARHDLPEILVPVIAALLIALLLFATPVSGGSGDFTRFSIGRALVVSGLLLFVPVVMFAAHEPLSTGQDRDRLRIMSYNVHAGFGRRGWLEIEEIARVIEAANVDVVALQEVPRGLVITGSADLAELLARRLGMNYAFAGRQHLGNAVLARVPILEAKAVALPGVLDVHRRNYLEVRLRLGAEELNLIATHLYHAGGATGTRVRELQFQEIFRTHPRAPTVLLGDLNAEPDFPEMRSLDRAGFVDAFLAAGGRPPGFTFPATEPRKRIDYIWTTPNLRVRDFRITGGAMSDHLAVSVEIAPR